MTIQHLLLDADGVLQTVEGGYRPVLEGVAGERWQELGRALGAAEAPCLRGHGDIAEALGGVLRDLEIDRPVEDAYAALWGGVRPVPTSIDLVERLREAGYGVHLGSNQHDRRAHHLRDAFGYADLFETLAISCELGVAKPDRAFFDAAVAQIGAPAAHVLFIDDHEPNVVGAREAGLDAVHWSLDLGHDALMAELDARGVRPVAPR